MNRCSQIQNRSHLDVLVARLIERVLAEHPAIEEGVVMTMEKIPYRRLDFGGRALCYIRVRPTKRCIRIDLAKPLDEYFWVAWDDDVQAAARRIAAAADRR